MSMKLGTISLNAVYLGTTSIAALYLGAAQVFGGGAVEFDPASLFASGEEGAWYEPSTSTAFTDTGGTISATYGDPVAYLQDLSGNDNHATQTTLASRPILARVPEGGRRNLLERTEEFDDAAWLKFEVTAPSPTVLQETTANKEHFASQQTTKIAASQTYTFGVRASQNSGTRNLGLGITNGITSGKAVIFSLVDGSVVLSNQNVGTGSGFTYVGQTSEVDGDDYIFSVTITTDAATRVDFVVYMVNGTTRQYGGSTSNRINVYTTQAELGSTATDYQKVVDEYDITESGVTSLEYLSFDGVDDYLSVGSNQITGSQDRTVFAALEIDSVGGINSFFDMGAEATGARYSHSAGYNSADIGIGISGSNTYWGSSPDTSPHVYVTVLEGDQLVDVSARKDGVTLSVNSSASPTNVINTSSSNTTIGVDVGLANFLNGNLYGLLVRGASSTTDEITNTEAYLATRSGVTL